MAYKKLKYWFDEELATELADKILIHFSEFNKSAFVKQISSQIPQQELKDRIETIADCFHNKLNQDYTFAITTLLKIIGPENENETGMFKEYYWIMPIAKYIEKYGLNDFSVSMNAIEEITKRNTGEYAIRPYLELYPKKTLGQMKKWSKNKNKHVRRLASEGVRPRLPWASKLRAFIDDPKPIIPILNNLNDDNSKYVQKSVANCLNDILKDNLKIGKTIIEDWNQTSISPERRWIIKHALRNLIKAEDKWALSQIRK